MAEESFSRKVIVFGDEFWGFYYALRRKQQKKIDWVIGLARSIRFIPEKYFKHLENEDGLFELRIKYGSNIYRIFCFFNDRNMLVLLNGFQKKTENTPKYQIEKARHLKRTYYEERDNK